MAGMTFSARAVAKLVASRSGRPCDAKRVRAWARASIARFDDEGYTTHAYTSAERDRIVNGLVARARANATGTAGRASSASRGRTAARKTSPARKATHKAPVAPVAPVAPATGNTDGTGAA
jgi:hypothetical protein